MAGTSGARGSGPIQGPQGKGSNAGGRPGRGANSPRSAPLGGASMGGGTSRVNGAPGSGRSEIAPFVGKPGQKASPAIKEKS